MSLKLIQEPPHVMRFRGFVRLIKYNISFVYYKKIHTFEVEGQSCIDPLKRVSVSPRTVSKFTGRMRSDEVQQVRKDIGTVRAGEWDRRSGKNISPHLPDCLTNILFDKRIYNTDIYKSFIKHFVDGIRWECTSYFDALVKMVNQGYEWHGCQSQDDIKEWLKKLDRLFISIRESGYKTQATLGKYSNILDELSNEVVVDRGRDGSFLLVCGRHRLIISRILELDKIPVTVAVRHRQFIETDVPSRLGEGGS